MVRTGSVAERGIRVCRSSRVRKSTPANLDQMDMMKSATHFNPVDLVCAMRDWQGKSHRLGELVEPATSFVAEKSVQGKALLALERPGLWNGGDGRMAHPLRRGAQRNVRSRQNSLRSPAA